MAEDIEKSVFDRVNAMAAGEGEGGTGEPAENEAPEETDPKETGEGEEEPVVDEEDIVDEITSETEEGEEEKGEDGSESELNPRELVAELKEFLSSGGKKPEGERTQKPAETEKAGETSPKTSGEKFQKLLKHLEEEYSKETADLFKDAIEEMTGSALGEVEKIRKEREEDARVQQSRAVHALIDDVVGSDSELVKRLGRFGRGSRLTPEQLKNREDVYVLASAIYERARTKGRQMADDEAIRAALKVLELDAKDKARKPDTSRVEEAAAKRSTLKTIKPRGSAAPNNTSAGHKSDSSWDVDPAVKEIERDVMEWAKRKGITL